MPPVPPVPTSIIILTLVKEIKFKRKFISRQNDLVKARFSTHPKLMSLNVNGKSASWH